MHRTIGTTRAAFSALSVLGRLGNRLLNSWCDCVVSFLTSVDDRNDFSFTFGAGKVYDSEIRYGDPLNNHNP